MFNKRAASFSISGTNSRVHRLTGHALVPNVDVVAACVRIDAGVKVQAGVAAASSTTAREGTDTQILISAGVVDERAVTNGKIIIAVNEAAGNHLRAGQS